MRGLVAIKRVVDYSVKVRVKADKSGIDLNNVKMSMNPFCEIAVEEAIRLKEKGVLSEIVTVSVGPEKTQETLRQALAMGVDRAVHISTGTSVEALSPFLIAQLLKKIVEKEKADLMLLGKQSIDGDNNQTGQILATLLNWPQATFASELVFDQTSKSFQVKREVDSGIQVVKLTTPCLVTADLRLNEPRFATLPNLMKAKKKPLEVIDFKSLGVDLTPKVQVLSVEEPPVRKGGIKVASVDELIDKLRNEAKVI